jgi:hypothetical protein
LKIAGCRIVGLDCFTLRVRNDDERVAAVAHRIVAHRIIGLDCFTLRVRNDDERVEQSHIASSHIASSHIASSHIASSHIASSHIASSGWIASPFGFAMTASGWLQVPKGRNFHNRRQAAAQPAVTTNARLAHGAQTSFGAQATPVRTAGRLA